MNAPSIISTTAGDKHVRHFGTKILIFFLRRHLNFVEIHVVGVFAISQKGIKSHAQMIKEGLINVSYMHLPH